MSIKRVFGEDELKWARIAFAFAALAVGGAGGSVSARAFGTIGVSHEQFEDVEARQAGLEKDVAVLKETVFHTAKQLDHIATLLESRR